MKKPIAITAAFLLCLVSVFAAHALEGKSIFTAQCGSCHRAGGEATVVAPSKYAAVQWQRFFEKDRHAAKKDIKNTFSTLELAAVQDYLVKHAADSEQPESLGVK